LSILGKLIKPGLRDEVDDKIDVLMNNDVKEALGLDASWGYQSGFVFDALYEDFMKPVTDIGKKQLLSRFSSE
jgi:serine carboxypeptidase 1